VIVTTPNSEYNVRYEFLHEHAAPGDPAPRRHPDHRFEWTRSEFAAWVDGVCAGYGYRVAIRPVGENDPEVGAPTQMAIFSAPGESAVPEADAVQVKNLTPEQNPERPESVVPGKNVVPVVAEESADV
jgi:hypothetical protein